MGRVRGDAAQFALKKEKRAIAKVLAGKYPSGVTWQEINTYLKKKVGYSLAYNAIRLRCDELVTAEKIHVSDTRGKRKARLYVSGPKPEPELPFEKEEPRFSQPAGLPEPPLAEDELISFMLTFERTVLARLEQIERTVAAIANFHNIYVAEYSATNREEK